ARRHPRSGIVQAGKLLNIAFNRYRQSSLEALVDTSGQRLGCPCVEDCLGRGFTLVDTGVGGECESASRLIHVLVAIAIRTPDLPDAWIQTKTTSHLVIDVVDDHALYLGPSLWDIR